MDVGRRSGQGAVWRSWRIMALLVLLLTALPAAAQDKVSVLATQEDGYGRIILAFADRFDLPPYRVRYENGVLAIEFKAAVNALLPDIALAIPDYATIARTDPDGKGVRIGLRTAVVLNRLEAGEKLFIDLLPPTWQGLPPALPAEVVAELSVRAKQAAELAEQRRRAELAKTLNPTATVRLGRNPTFLRLQVDWSVDTEAKFSLKDGTGTIDFGWPVPVDLYALKADLPAEFKGATNTVTPTSSLVTLKVAEGVEPRFYQLSPRQFVVDIDISPEAGLEVALKNEEAAKKARDELARVAAEGEERRDARLGLEGGEGTAELYPTTRGVVAPLVTTVGGTIRIGFPFEADTASAVFRRGDTVWMVFDTSQTILKPTPAEPLAQVVSNVEVVPAGDTQVVRLDLAEDRLATLGSEGRSWVLSLGDVLLNATEPMTLTRQRDEQGLFEISADVMRPGTVHVLRDPVVGDALRVVTVLPPARGVTRDLAFVDFSVLKSAHGLVVKPNSENLDVSLLEKTAEISASEGLTLSAVESLRSLDAGNAPQFRQSYIDLAVWREDDPGRFQTRKEELIGQAADAEGRVRDMARLDLGQFLLANEFSYEAIGVLSVLESELTSEDLRKKLRLLNAIADVAAGRPMDALPILNSGSFPEETDALLWRSMARADAGDFRGARLDAIAAEPVFSSYPLWVRNRFLFSAIRAAVETSDEPLALQMIGKLEFAKLSPEEISLFQLMQGRIAELEEKEQDALDAYGQVITADVRPTRAEAVYRTLLLLERSGKIDLAKATDTLSAEALMWRGGTLEADMQKLLAELYFENKDYKQGFEIVRQAASSFPENSSINDLLNKAQTQFENLYLNGEADRMGDVEALSLYYDFRQLTPPGARGDEMIRNLVRRLVKVDLLSQAADLLEYQIDSRLEGVAKAQVAADLAVIRIADRDPEAALRVLNRTRLADLSPVLDRQRRLLEARALIDAGRQDLAIDLISRLTGRDADMLRVDGYWKSKNYDTAAGLLETIYSPASGSPPMTQQARMGAVRAAVGYVLANDAIGLSRLRSKFSDAMSQSAEWPLFEFVTRDVAPQSLEFKKVAKEIAGLDSLDAFLSSYRELYAGADAVLPQKAKPQGAA